MTSYEISYLLFLSPKAHGFTAICSVNIFDGANVVCNNTRRSRRSLHNEGRVRVNVENVSHLCSAVFRILLWAFRLWHNE